MLLGGITSPEPFERDAFSVSGLLTILFSFTPFPHLCLDLCLWPLLATVVSGFQGP